MTFRQIIQALILLFAVLTSTVLLGQNDGPAGIQNSTTNRFWLRTSEISQANNTAVATWPNIGGNTLDAEQVTAADRPLFLDNITDNINTFPVLRFDGTDDMEIANTTDLNSGGPWDERTFTVAFKTGADVTTRMSVYEEGGGLRGIIFYIEGGFLYAGMYNGNNDGAASPWTAAYLSAAVSPNTEYVLTFIYDGGTVTSNGYTSAYLNGSLMGTSLGVGTFYGHNNTRIGGGNSMRDRIGTAVTMNRFSGDYMEVIIFDNPLSIAERTILENSLAAKYGIAMTGSLVYQMSSAANGNFDFDVIGIGQDNSGDNNTSADNAGFIIENADDISNNEYLMGGNDGQGVSAWLTANSPDAASISYLDRQWRFSEIGDVGNLDISWDLSGFAALPGVEYSWAVMIDDDGDYSSGALIYELQLVSGNEYTLPNPVNISDGQYLRIAAVRPAISFESAAQSDLESNNASLSIQLNHIPESDKSYTVLYSTADGTATAPGDYTAVPAGSQLVTFTAGDDLANLPDVTVIDDAISEPDKDFTVTIAPGTGYLAGTIPTVTHTILDDDNPIKVYFSSNSSSANEAVSPASIIVEISAATASDVDINWSVTGGTATSPADFTPTSGTVTITGGLGLTSTTIDLAIVDDGVYEPDETIIVELTSAVNASLDNPGAPTGTGILQHTYTIQNDDFPTLEFNMAAQSFSESDGGQFATITSDLAIADNISITYSFGDNTAINGTDYNGVDAVGTLLSGQTSFEIPFSLLDNCIVDGNKDFTITIDAVSIGLIGATSSQTVTITDNDLAAPGGIGCNVEFWFNASTGVTLNGSDVVSWADNSLNGNDASQSVGASRPDYVTGANDPTFNYEPYLTFNGSSDRLAVDLGYTFTSGLAQYYVFAAFRTGFAGSGGLSDNWSFVDFDRSEYFNCYVHGGNYLSTSFTTAADGILDNDGTTPVNDDEPHLGTFSYDASRINDVYIALDGTTELTANVISAAGRSLGTGTTRFAYIGDGSESSSFEGTGNNVYYDGEIAEIFYVRNLEVTHDELNRIQSYFAIKYGLTLNMPNFTSTPTVDERNYRLSDGTVIWNFSTNSTYHNQVAGIARDDAGSLTKTKSKSTDAPSIVAIESGALGDKNSLVWGNDGAATSSSTNTPTGWRYRLTRLWKAQELNEIGALTVSFDISGIAGLPADAGEFSLLIDSDTDFSDATAHITGASLVGNVITFTGADIDDGNFFTLGYDKIITWDGVAFANGSGPGGAPDLTDGNKLFVVEGPGCVLTANARVDQMIINGGHDITINAGISLSIVDLINNEGTVSVESTGSIVQESVADNNTGAGIYHIERDDIRPNLEFQGWSSPIQSAQLMGPGGVFDGSNPCRTMVWNASSQRWKYDYVPGSVYNCGGGNITFTPRFLMFDDPADNLMDPARGYFIPGQNGSPTLTFSGQINNGTLIKPVFETNSTSPYTGDDWNLLGNPYPSALSIPLWLTANSAALSTVAVYLWDDDGSGGVDYDEFDDYAVINLFGFAGGEDGNGTHPVAPVGIATGQGFFVEASAIGNVSFTNAMRITGNNDKFYKTQPDDNPKLWINLNNQEGLQRQTLIGFASDATFQKDEKYDAPVLNANGILSIGTMLESTPMAILAQPFLVEGDERFIPLHVLSKDGGKAILSFIRNEAMDGIEVYLKVPNQLAEIFIDDSEIDLGLNKGINDGYALIFRKGNVLSNSSINKNFGWEPIYTNDELMVEIIGSMEPDTRIEVLDLKGVVHETVNVTDRVTRINTQNWAAGMYLVHLKSGSRDEVKRVVIR
jgi:hypothetical protein